MAPDTGPNENSNKNDDYLSKAPPYNIEDDFSDDDSDYGNGNGNDDDLDEDIDGGDNIPGYQLLNQEGGEDSVDDHIHHHARGGGGEEDEEEEEDDNISDSVNANNTFCNPVNQIASSFPSSLINSLPPAPVDQISKQSESIPRPDIELDDSKIDQIKRVMSGFSLPSSSIPGWASVVTEDQLANFVHRKTTSN